MATDATLTSKGQVTIPEDIREALRMKPGDRITFTLLVDGTVIMRAKTRRLPDLAGILYKKGRKPVTIDEMSR